MRQYDILGGETEIKEHRRKRRNTVSQPNAPVVANTTTTATISRTKPTVVTTTTARENTLVATIEKKVSLKNHQIVTTTHYTPEFKTQHENSRENVKGNTGEYNGYMSQNTSRYVKRIIENWLTAIELNQENKQKDYNDQVYVTFLTLTLPCKQVHGDNYIKNQCLDPMIEWLRSSEKKNKRSGAGVDAYLWRAESQKNGDIHFHLILDRWVVADLVRMKWNQIIERLKYITMYQKTQKYIYRDGFKFREEQAEKQIEKLQYVLQNAIEDNKLIPDTKYVNHPMVRETLNQIIQDYRMMPATEKKKMTGFGLSEEVARMLVYKMQYKAYQIGCDNGWTNPNTTDIKKLGSIYSVSSYITKYVSKSDIVEPKLQKNQRALVKEQDGKRRIYTLCENGSWDNLLDYYDENAPLYEITFTSRMVRGRLWGKSRNLSDGADGKKIQAAQFVTETKIIADDVVWGRQITRWNTNDDISEYVENVKQEIPEEEVKRVADIIQSDYCEVIPLGKYATKVHHKTKKKIKYFKPIKQVEFLQKVSPEVAKRYLTHYDNIFQMIYGSNSDTSSHLQIAA